MNYNKNQLFNDYNGNNTWEINESMKSLHLKHYRILCLIQVLTFFKHFDVWWLSDGFLMLFPYLAAGRAVVNRVAEG